ncbi:MAG: DUF4143 domain-containing protein [Candidatus Altiarchaeota archaeon]|nr:DUF4143 domain-containing protein [Candidatus Altiarchaeota archaeon]
MVEKMIFQDIPQVFSIRHEELLLRLLKITASNPGMLSDYRSLSNEIGINRVTISKYFFYLEESFLIKKLYNFSKNMLTSEKKMKKFYLTTTSLFPFLNNEIDEAKLIENLVAVSVNARFFWRTPQKYEVDIVLEREGKIIPAEVKYKTNIRTGDLKNLLRFCKQFNLREAVMITRDRSGEDELEEGIRIKFIPAWEFLLEIE